MKFTFLCLLLLIASPALAQVNKGAAASAVSVTSSSAGTQLVSGISEGTTVMVPASAAVAIWVTRLNGTCSTDLTAIQGIRIKPGDGYEFTPRDGWYGQLCGILESGSTAVSAKVNSW